MIYNLLKKLKLPVAYHKFEETPSIPFLIYRGNGTDNFIADNEVYNAEYKYVIEYYFDNKNTEREKAIEELFNKNKIVWRKSDDIYIESERLFLINYYI